VNLKPHEDVFNLNISRHTHRVGTSLQASVYLLLNNLQTWQTFL